ncbi:MAG TPA: PP2C family protein-serine/threonine phosphatase, partial [Bacteroidota bacterium]
TPYEQGVVTLAPGDVLVLFTDGVSEAMDKDSVEYGEDRLEALVLSQRARSAEQMVELIHKDILLHSKGTSQSDDITMMIVKVV